MIYYGISIIIGGGVDYFGGKRGVYDVTEQKEGQKIKICRQSL